MGLTPVYQAKHTPFYPAIQNFFRSNKQHVSIKLYLLTSCLRLFHFGITKGLLTPLLIRKNPSKGGALIDQMDGVCPVGLA